MNAFFCIKYHTFCHIHQDVKYWSFSIRSGPIFSLGNIENSRVPEKIIGHLMHHSMTHKIHQYRSGGCAIC